MSSHNLPEVEKVCSNVAIIKKGKMVATESILTLREKKLYSVKVFFKSKPEANFIAPYSEKVSMLVE